MYLATINPIGILCCYNLDALGVWRLELGAVGTQLGLGIRYVTTTPSGTAFGFITALDVDNPQAASALQSIVKMGLPRHNPEGDRQRLAEGIKILYNAEGMKPAVVDQLIPVGTKFATIYHELLQAISTGSSNAGEHNGWRWSLSPSKGDFKWVEKQSAESNDEDKASTPHTRS